MQEYDIEFFTFDKILGIEKTVATKRTILDCVKAFDEANEKLYNELVSVQRENEELKKKLRRHNDLGRTKRRSPKRNGRCKMTEEVLEARIEVLEEQIERLQEQLNEANEVIKHYANDENWCDYYDDDDEKMTKAIYIYRL